MSTQERKKKLIQFIQKTTDTDLLKQVEMILDPQTDWANDLTPAQIEGIRLADEQIQSGKTVSHDEVWSLFRQKRT